MAVNIPTQINVSLSLKEVKCISFSLTDYGKENKTSIVAENYEFELNLETSINENEKILVLKFTAKLFVKEKNAKHELAELKSLTIFNVINFNDIVIVAPMGRGFPDQILIACSAIALSHTRGMYSVKLEDTLYSNAIVPVVDGSLFLPKKPQQIG